MDSHSDYSAELKIVQDYSTDPRVVQYSHSDYSADPRAMQYSAEGRTILI